MLLALKKMIYIINFLIFFFDFNFLKNRPFSLFVISFFCFQLIVGVGVPFVELMDRLVGYKMPLNGLFTVELYYLTFSVVFLLTFWVMGLLFESAGVDFQAKNLTRDPYDKPALMCLAIFAAACAFLYIAMTGLNFGSSGYESRYEEARGVGFLIIFFPAFMPFMVSKFIDIDKKGDYFRNIFLWVLVGFFTYVVLQGYRQILIAVILFIGLFLLNRNFFSTKVLFLGVFLLMPLVLVGLSFLRYAGESDSAFSSPLEAAFYFIQGDLFPVDAILKTSIYLEQYSAPGMSVFWEHFYRFIPRFIMEDKPEILMNAAGFYTLEIVGYSRGVTLSPTILSEGLMVSGGVSGIVFLAFFSGLFCFFYDYVLRTTKKYSVYVFQLSFLYMGFFIIREGLQAGLYRVFLVCIFFFVFLSIKFFLKIMYGGRLS
jgi:antigen polymerase